MKTAIIVTLTAFFLSGCGSVTSVFQRGGNYGPSQEVTYATSEVEIDAADDQPLGIDLGIDPSTGIPTKFGLNTHEADVERVRSKGSIFRVKTEGETRDVYMQGAGDFTVDGSDNSSAHDQQFQIWYDHIDREKVPDMADWKVFKPDQYHQPMPETGTVTNPATGE